MWSRNLTFDPFFMGWAVASLPFKLARRHIPHCDRSTELFIPRLVAQVRHISLDEGVGVVEIVRVVAKIVVFVSLASCLLLLLRRLFERFGLGRYGWRCGRYRNTRTACPFPSLFCRQIERYRRVSVSRWLRLLRSLG